MAEALISLDQFPALVLTPLGGRYEQARTVVYNGIVQVWVNGAGGPSVVYERNAVSVQGNRIAGYEVLTDDGVLRTNPGGGCGCGNTLKTFDVYGGLIRKAVPL